MLHSHACIEHGRGEKEASRAIRDERKRDERRKGERRFRRDGWRGEHEVLKKGERAAR